MLRRSTGTALWVVLVVIVCLLLISAVVLMVHWPFNEANVRKSLGSGFHGKVTFTSYRQVYWPNPGLIAEGVVLRRSDDQTVPPLASCDRLAVTDRWATIISLQHRLRLIELQGLKILIPAAGSRERAADFPPGDGKAFRGPSTFLEMVKVENGVLEVDQPDGHRFLLPIPKLTMENVYRGRAAAFDVDVNLQHPAGAIHARGNLGPIDSSRLSEMPMAADFSIQQMQLEGIGKLKGTLGATGKLSGTLGAIGVEGAVQTGDFAVGMGRATGVRTLVQATVNGLNGDTELRDVIARSGSTEVRASGTVAGKPKVTHLQIAVEKGRMEDLMRPFLATRPAMVGEVSGRTSADIAPAAKGTPFLDRLTMEARFTIPGARFTLVTTEQSMSAFSRRARGMDPGSPAAKPGPGEPEVALALNSGQVTLRNGVAQTGSLLATLPGAEIHLGGSFNFKTDTANLTGNLSMKPDLSHVTTGFKAKLLKPLSPFFRHGKKPNQETIVPIKVTGTKHYKVSGNLFGAK